MAKKKAVETKEDGIDHATLLKWVNDADEKTASSRTLSEKARDYYDSEQWTDAEKAALKARKQAPTVSNRIKPKIDSLMGMESTNRTTAKAFPRTPKHEKAATAGTEAIRYALDDNDFDNVRSSAFENIAIEGSGGCEVIVKARGDEFDVVIKGIMWDRMLYDHLARKKDFSDARWLGQELWMDKDEALDLYPGAKDILETMTRETRDERWMDSTRQRVRIVEVYYHEHKKVMYACFTGGGFCDEPKVSPYKNEDGESEWPYEFASAFVDRKGGRYGPVKQHLDVQDEINKRRSKFLHLVSVRQVRLEKGAVEDVNLVRSELAKPDGVIETTPGMEFEILKTGDMAAAQFNLLQEAKQEIDASGANAALQGRQDGSPSGKALIARENAGKTELAPLFDVLKHWDIRVYRKVWNRIKQYWKGEKWIRVTDDENNLRWVGLNKPITKGEQMLQQAQEQGAQPQALRQMQRQIQMDPRMQEVVSTENDIAQLDVDIILTEVPDATTAQIEDFQVLGEMVKSGFPMPPEAVIKASPLNHKDEILKMMKEKPQLPPEVQEQMKKTQEQLQKLTEENQSLKADQQVEGAKIQAKAQSDNQAFEIKRKAAQDEIALKKMLQDAELQALREKNAEIIKLEREKAEADIALEAMKIRAAADGDVDKGINQIKILAERHLAKLTGMQEVDQAKADAKAEGEKKEAEADNTKVMQDMQKQFLGAVEDIVKALTAKKTVSAKLSDGRTISVNT